MSRVNRSRFRTIHLGVSLLALSPLVLAGCSSSDLSDMEEEYPLLVDIPPRPDEVESSQDKAEIIEALREEAEARKDEGFQAPE